MFDDILDGIIKKSTERKKYHCKNCGNIVDDEDCLYCSEKCMNDYDTWYTSTYNGDDRII